MRDACFAILILLSPSAFADFTAAGGLQKTVDQTSSNNVADQQMHQQASCVAKKLLSKASESDAAEACKASSLVVDAEKKLPKAKLQKVGMLGPSSWAFTKAECYQFYRDCQVGNSINPIACYERWIQCNMNATK